MLSLALVTLLASSPDVPAPKVDLPLASTGGAKTAVLAMGCFWCSEAVFEAVQGVSDVVSGYAGDTKDKATYDQVSAHSTKHAESVRITYDPAKISYGTLLRVFFTTHNPTTLDRSGPDTGHQYRSAIFYANDDEKRVAEAYIKQLTEAKVFSDPIVTTLEPLKEFFPAEEYHQNFVKRHPDHPYVEANSIPKLEKLRTKLPALVKK